MILRSDTDFFICTIKDKEYMNKPMKVNQVWEFAEEAFHNLDKDVSMGNVKEISIVYKC
jgi:hypothetical protein